MSVHAYINGRLVVGHGELPHEVHLPLHVMIDGSPISGAVIQPVYLSVVAARKNHILLERKVSLIPPQKITV